MPETRRVFRLLYASRVAPDAAAELDATLREVLGASIRNNRLDAITGLLVAHDGWFVQALEGPETAVRATYARIAADPRHTRAGVLAAEAAEARLFGRWTMCAHTLSAADAVLLAGLPAGAFDPAAAGADAMLSLLLAVAEAHRRLLTEQYAEFEGRPLPLG